MSCSEWFPATNLQKILRGIEKELPRTHKKNTFKRFFLQFKPPNFCSQVLCEMVFDEGFWFQQTASFVPPPVCKDVIYESMNGDGPCLAILRNALENSKVADTDWWNFGAPKLLWVMFRCGSYSSHYLMTQLFLYRCNESYEIQIYSSGGRVCTDLGQIFLNFFYHQLVPDWKKSTPSCVFFSQMMTQRIATKSSINARKSHQRVKSAMKCPLTGVKKGATSCFWGRKTARCVDVVNPIIFTWDLKRCL